VKMVVKSMGSGRLFLGRLPPFHQERAAKKRGFTGRCGATGDVYAVSKEEVNRRRRVKQKGSREAKGLKGPVYGLVHKGPLRRSVAGREWQDEKREKLEVAKKEPERVLGTLPCPMDSDVLVAGGKDMKNRRGSSKDELRKGEGLGSVVRKGVWAWARRRGPIILGYVSADRNGAREEKKRSRGEGEKELQEGQERGNKDDRRVSLQDSPYPVRALQYARKNLQDMCKGTEKK